MAVLDRPFKSELYSYNLLHVLYWFALVKYYIAFILECVRYIKIIFFNIFVANSPRSFAYEMIVNVFFYLGFSWMGLSKYPSSFYLIRMRTCRKANRCYCNSASDEIFENLIDCNKLFASL